MSNNQKPRTLSSENFLKFAKEIVELEWRQSGETAQKMRSTHSVASLEELGAAQSLLGEKTESESSQTEPGNVIAFQKRDRSGQ